MSNKNSPLPSSTPIAAILVGGKGTRLRSVISDVPKPLAPIAGEPFLFFTLRQLAAAGIKKVILLTGYLHQQIVDACGDGKQFGLEITYSQETEALGTAGALANAASLLKPYSEFILLNGDTYLDCDLHDFIHFPLEPNWIGMIGTMLPTETARFGSLEIHANTLMIEAFKEKDAATKTASTHIAAINAGIYKLSSTILSKIPQRNCSLEQEIFPEVLAQNLGLRAFSLAGEFIDIGIPETYFAFNHRMTSEKA